jgi:hypothetical protein
VACIEYNQKTDGKEIFMSTFCPFMSNAQGKVACDTDCQLYWENNDGLEIGGKTQSGCSQRLSALAIAQISACKTTFKTLDGDTMNVFATLDRSLMRAMRVVGNKDYISLRVNTI